MMRTGKEFHGTPISAVDGELGSVHDFYFDDRTWKIRYLVVSVGNQPLPRHMFISPFALATFEGKRLTLQLTQEEARKCLGESTGRMSVEQMRNRTEQLLYEGYGWGETRSAVVFPEGCLNSFECKESGRHFHSCRITSGYTVSTMDGNGKMEDLLFDDRDWSVRFLLINTDRDEGTRVSPTSLVDSIGRETESLQLGCRQRRLLECARFNPELHVDVSL
jgi:uncharacterized protein YrrD